MRATKKARDWPKSPRGLAGRLRRFVTFLRESGIQITFPRKGTKGRRALTIQRIDRQPTATNATTATPPTNFSSDHSDTTEPAGGDSDPQGDDVSLGPDQPPPPYLVADPLNGLENQAPVAEVAIVAVGGLDSWSAVRTRRTPLESTFAHFVVGLIGSGMAVAGFAAIAKRRQDPALRWSGSNCERFIAAIAASRRRRFNYLRRRPLAHRGAAWG